MKRLVVIGLMIFMFALCGCKEKDNVSENKPSKNNTAEELNTMEQLEGYEGLSDEEITQKMIEEADKIQVVPDKTE